MTVDITAYGLLHGCHHIAQPISFVILYCLVLSSWFVGGLYYMIPRTYRHLPRDDVRQIKWRMITVTVVSIATTLAYPVFFCQSTQGEETEREAVGALRYMGWSWRTGRDLAIPLHTAVLYSGPIVALILKIRVDGLRGAAAKPGPSERWRRARDLLVAPLAEEIVFRACMAAPLLSSGLSPTAAAWTAPLFFGTAHGHHAFLKLREGYPVKMVAMSTAFQFAYTSLFGAYATHAFIRTGSVPAVVLCHSFCNYMGLPDLGFLKERGEELSCVYQYRHIIMSSYIVGMVLFVMGFLKCTEENKLWCSFFPEDSVLPSLVMGT